MNEEITRVLDLLEEGKIAADEAERLIRAVCEARLSGARERRAERPAAHDDLRAACRWIRMRCRQMARTRHTVRWWRHFADLRCREDERARRARHMPAAERVAYVLDAYLLRGGPPPDARLREDLGLSGMEWELLRYAMEHEFGVGLLPGDLRACVTVADLVALVSPTPPPDDAGGPSGAPEPDHAREADPEPEPLAGAARPRPRRARGTGKTGNTE
ncbi:MAG TPA: hypothetical protein VLH79_09870 [Chthonomonadales bacterium]|nr:hypothetical protein [Chthonomonadales bacterium]